MLFRSPIIDHFFKIRIEVISIENTGWIREKQDENIYGFVEIPVPDILGGVANNKDIYLPLTMTKKTMTHVYQLKKKESKKDKKA